MSWAKRTEVTLLMNTDADSYDAASELVTEKEKRSTDQDNIFHQKTTSSFASLMHIIKACMGIGILSLPMAIMYAGIVLGPVILMTTALSTVYCMHLLLECNHVLCERTGSPHLDFGELAAKCVEIYLPSKGYLGRIIVNVSLLIAHGGLCSIYFVFISQSLKQVTGLSFDVRLWVLILLLPTIMFSFIRALKTIAVLSGMSNILLAIGLACVLYYNGTTAQNPQSLPLFPGWARLPYTFAMATTAFEGIGVILPLANTMAKPEDFPCVVNIGLLVVTLLYLLVSVIGYLSCGTRCYGSITLNLPNTPFYISIKLLIAMAIYLTYFIQFYVPVSFLLPALNKRVAEKFHTKLEYGFRVFLVTLTAILAVSIPRLNALISLIGSISSTAICLTIPATMHMLVFNPKSSSFKCWQFVINILVVLIGVIGSVTGFYTSLVNVIHFYGNGAKDTIGSN